MSVEMINGARTSFGPRDAEAKVGASVITLGAKKQLKVPVKFDELPEHIEGDVTGVALPANALITAVYAVPALEEFADGTSYDVNMVQDDGTLIAAVATATLAEMNSGAEVTITTPTVGADVAYLEVAETDTFTAGIGCILIEYIEQYTMLNA